jgi:hypothetical protein
MPERIINCPVTKNTFVESWFARFGHDRFPRALPHNGFWGFSFAAEWSVFCRILWLARSPNPDPFKHP